jgi:hypothetical protein
MPSTPPLLAEPIGTRLNEPNSAVDDSMTSSSLSFIALSAEQPRGMSALFRNLCHLKLVVNVWRSHSV